MRRASARPSSTLLLGLPGFFGISATSSPFHKSAASRASPWRWRPQKPRRFALVGPAIGTIVGVGLEQDAGVKQFAGVGPAVAHESFEFAALLFGEADDVIQFIPQNDVLSDAPKKTNDIGQWVYPVVPSPWGNVPLLIAGLTPLTARLVAKAFPHCVANPEVLEDA